MKHKKLLLGLLLLLGVGFALVSTTLLITGNIRIATNNADFDVRFTKAVLDGIDISETAISSDGKTITFETNDLSTVGDISKLDFEVTNNSEMYDAEVSINCTAEGAKNSYYEITKEVASPIVGKTTGTGNVQVKLLKASVNDFSETFTCNLTATAKERDTKAEVPQIYYAFGDPATAADRTTDYRSLTYPSSSSGAGQQAKVFVKLEGTQKSLCIIRSSALSCFKNNNWEEEKTHITQVFSDSICSSDSFSVNCNASDFRCYVQSNGMVFCNDNAYSHIGIDLFPSGTVRIE